MKRSTLCFVLVLALPALFGAAANAQPQGLEEACFVVLDQCLTNCEGRTDAAAASQCRIGCENAAVTCSPGEEATLRPDEYLAFLGEEPIFTEAAACHDTTPCPTQYGACTSWSSYSDCGDTFCGGSSACKFCDEYGQCIPYGPATKKYRERYRVCFNQQMQGCTEYQRVSVTLGCGC